MTNTTKQQEFIGEYNELCKKYGVQLTAMPRWVLRDDGSYSMVIKWSVQEVKTNEQEV